MTSASLPAPAWQVSPKNNQIVFSLTRTLDLALPYNQNPMLDTTLAMPEKLHPVHTGYAHPINNPQYPTTNNTKSFKL